MKTAVLLRRLTEFNAKRWDPERQMMVDDDPPVNLLKPAAATVGAAALGAGAFAGHRAVMRNYGGREVIGGGAVHPAAEAYVNAGRNVVKTGSDFLKGRVAAAREGATAGRATGEAIGAKGGKLAADLVAKLRKALAGKKLFVRPEGARLVELAARFEEAEPTEFAEWRPRRVPEQDDTYAPERRGRVVNHIAGVALAGVGVAGAARTIQKAGGLKNIATKVAAARGALRMRRAGKGFTAAAAAMRAAG